MFFYVLFGGLWIAVSDRVLEALVSDKHKLTLLQTYKGWAFVAASALLLYVLARRELRNREQAEEALRGSEERYRMLMRHANDGIVIVDAETGLILEANQRIEELTGRPSGELIGKHIAELHPDRNRELCRKLFQEAVAQESTIRGDLCVVHRGEEDRDIPVEISASIVEINGRKVIQGIFRDITRRRAAEEAEQKEKERAEQYLDVAGVMIRVLDRTGNVILINRKGREILGYEEAEIVGKNWFDVFVPERSRSEIRAVFDGLINGDPANAEYYENPIVTRSGEERLIAWHNSLLRNDTGQVIATLSSGEDITDRKKAEELARHRLEHLAALHAIDMIISSSLDLRVTLHAILDLVITQIHVDAADILLLDQHTQMLDYAAMQGFRDSHIRHSRLRLGEGIAGRAALEHRSIGIPNLLAPSHGSLRSQLLEGEEFVTYYVVPLIAKGQVLGVLEILHRSPRVFDEESISILEALSAQAAIAIDNATLFNDLQQSNAGLVLAYDTTIEGWARALELRDQETEGHTQRAMEMTLRLAQAMGIKEEELVHVRRGALLHDIGKMSIPDSILLKNGPLSEKEWEIMRRHPVYAFELLSPITYLRPALDIPYCHHERWDGTGYPRGLNGEQIPIAARIFALADTWDALYSERRYHPAWPEDRVREHIRSLAGTQLDPKIVTVFLGMEQELKEQIENKIKI